MKDNYIDEEFNQLGSWENIEKYWKNKKQWIDSEHRLKLNLLPDYRLNDEEYCKMRQEVREIMELNMVMYGRW